MKVNEVDLYSAIFVVSHTQGAASTLKLQTEPIPAFTWYVVAVGCSGRIISTYPRGPFQLLPFFSLPLPSLHFIVCFILD